ncbi:MAG: bifunctional proline dehydrogenase/L-glutamate gamma-semialdehyde dehydrogenase PutA, partial [Pseudomonadota bacterium]
MDRAGVRALTLADEAPLVARLSAQAALSKTARSRISDAAADLVRKVRAAGPPGMMEQLLAEYGLSTEEGVALMCLAEALLRVPDAPTIDALIKDKITPHNWGAHLGDSGSILVNASTWGLLLTGRVLDDEAAGIAGVLQGLVRRLGEPVIRRAVGQAMAEMGAQFVLGRDINEAMARGQSRVAKGYTYSYDMLGEAARTDADAQRYLKAYADAIAALAASAPASDVRSNPGISVKLSALHPRYEAPQRDLTLPTLTERLLFLARSARGAGIGFNIDAEEADRLDLSLDVIEAALADPALAGWDGFGVVVQAFGKRADAVIDWLYARARDADRRIMVRLVKGAYWDTEIKRAQVMGLEDYPVFTRKTHTDIAYLAAAQKLLGMTDRIYPQFATHNAHSAAAILHMAGNAKDAFEFQRLHGMGEALHEVLREAEGTRCRIYAPVGAHRDLLAYLVRRLLENGANSSFVNQIVDLDVHPEEIATCPIAAAEAAGFAPNPALGQPRDLFEPRRNSRGWDLTDPVQLTAIEAGRAAFASHQWRAGSTAAAAIDIRNPADPQDIVGHVHETPVEAVAASVAAAADAGAAWDALGGAERAKTLRRAADLFEGATFEFLALLSREAGKTLLDGVAEIREAVDFLRYYADAASDIRAGTRPRGVVACISPWNFPLAIFAGQVAAALGAGNAVIAKPAEQTPLVAARAVALLHQAGVPEQVLALMPGAGATVGAALTADPRLGGVAFTGSTETAKMIDRQLAETAPDAMLIAETGGLNAMVVDSTALLEQAVRDITRSAFQSAGQRCSALRMLYVQSDVAVDLRRMLEGAMDTLSIGNPWEIETDVGPVIDLAARTEIERYLAGARVAKRLSVPDAGHFVAPTLVEVQGIEDLEREIFGPVLHIATFEAGEIDDVIAAINATGYGLTFGLHTRIDQRVQRIVDRIDAGNIYVNRDQIGAVVGSQPFGGHGLSGTGPKAGGPHYLPQFRTGDARAEARPETGDLLDLEEALAALEGLSAGTWAHANDRIQRLRALLRGSAAAAMAASAALDAGPVDLPGPTGEANQAYLRPRGRVLCLGPTRDTLLAQVVQALAGGNAVLAIAEGAVLRLRPLLRGGALPLVALDGTLTPEAAASLDVDAIAFAGSAPALRAALAARPGAIRPLIGDVIAPAGYTTEHAV